MFTSIESGNDAQLQKIVLNTYSDTTWDITPPNFDSLVDDLEGMTKTFYINFYWEFVR